MKCVYHVADLDGQCSGAIVKERYPDCELIGMNYGDPFPFYSVAPGEDVWVVDFHLQPFEDMARLNDLCRLTWIDHHKSAFEDKWKFNFTARGAESVEPAYAACELTWMMVHDTRPMPLAVRFLGRYDIWKHDECPGALDFQYGMRLQEDTRPENQEFWRRVLADELTGDLVKLGKTLLTYEERQNAKYCTACAFEVQLDGLRCIAINRGLAGSLSMKSVYDPEKHDAMLSFVMRKAGQWTVNLYTDKPEVDVSAICKARGGGGHKGAAGFVCGTLPF